jgi:hypothetical protein
MCITQCKFFVPLYCIVFHCELCITQSINCMYIMTLLQTILTKDWQMTDPTSRQRGRPKLDRTVTFKEKKYIYISGQKSQIGLDTKTYWLTDCQLQCNADAERLSHPLSPTSQEMKCIPQPDNHLPLSHFNYWKMHIIWCPLNLLISPVACFKVYCVTQFFYWDFVVSSLLAIQVLPSTELPLTLG